MRPNPDEIAAAVCRWSGVTLDRIRSNGRDHHSVKARAMVCYALHEWAGLSYPEIAEWFDLNTMAHSTYITAAHRFSADSIISEQATEDARRIIAAENRAAVKNHPPSDAPHPPQKSERGAAGAPTTPSYSRHELQHDR